MSEITIRRARDQRALIRLAALDSAAPLTGDVLVAETGGNAVAALELATGRIVADPFRRTAHVVDLLRLRARGEPGGGRRRGRRTLLFPRAA